MTTAEAGGHVAVATVAGSLVLIHPAMVVAGILLFTGWALYTSR